MTKFYYDKDVWITKVGIIFFMSLLFFLLYDMVIKNESFFSIGNIIIILSLSCILFWLIYISFILRYYFYDDKVIIKRLFSNKTYLIKELSNIQIIDQKTHTRYSSGKAIYFSYMQRSEDLHIKNSFSYTKLILFQFNNTTNPVQNTYITKWNSIKKDHFVIEYRRNLDFYLYLYEQKLREQTQK